MRTKVYGIRLSEIEEKLLKTEAKRNNLSLAGYIRQLARLKVDLKATVRGLQKNSGISKN